MPAGISAWTPLANITLANSSAANITFSSISQSYRDLVLIGYSNTLADANLFINGTTAATNYSTVEASGNGSSAFSTNSSGLATAQVIGYSGGVTANNNFVVNFLDYSVTDKHKTYMTRWNDPSYRATMRVTRFASTAAITSITLNVGSTWTAGTSFALYGVSA